jgi:hypothetical protein
MIETDLVAHLGAYGSLAAIVGARIYPESLPQEPTLPAMTYFQVSNAPAHVHDGSYNWALKRFQFDLFASTYLVCKQIKRELVLAMQAFAHVNHMDTDQDIPEPELSRYRLQIDYLIEDGEA